MLGPGGGGHTRSRGPDSSYLLMPSGLGWAGLGGTGGFVPCFPVECVAQFVQVSSDMNSECFQLENNFIICYHRAVISTRPTLITRHRGREREAF